LQLVDEYRGAATLPPDTFHATGHEGQFISIVPSRQLVVVRLGLTRSAEAWHQDEFVRRVLDAIAK
jgi:CubicO group peptidase (beta-lactamase class C family)